MNRLYCALTGKETTMRVRVILRIILFLVLVGIKELFGMDIVLITVAVVVVSDLDAIADAVEKRFRKDC